MNKLRMCFFFFWLINSCGSDHKLEGNQLSSIIGADNRVKKQSLVETSIGSLEFDGQTRCTTVLIDNRTVVTARHCYDHLWARYGSYRVKINGKSYFVKPLLDFANLDLIELFLLPVTDSLKNSTEEVPDISQSFYKLSLDKVSKQESYSLDQIDPVSGDILTQDSKGSDIEEELGFFFHNFDTIPGASGSPIFVGNKIIGIHIGATKSGLKNLAVSSRAFAEEKKRILKCRSIGYEEGSEDCESQYNVRKLEPFDECYDNPGAAAGAAAGTYAGATAGAAAGGAGCTVVAPGAGTFGCGLYGAGVGSAVGAVVGACVGGYMWETYYSPTSVFNTNNSDSYSNSTSAPQIPNFWDPSQAPGANWEWRGRPDSRAGEGPGNWVYRDPVTGQMQDRLNPDLNHPPGQDPHWDWTDRNGKQWRIFENGRVEPK